MTRVTKTKRAPARAAAAEAWSLADAKARLSEVVDRARSDGPQEITRHGKPAAVVVSIDAWRALQVRREPLVAFLRRGLREIDVERQSDPGRDVDL